ncbi:type IV pilus secretin PilQ [Halomonas sp. 328]|uniref:type IV pilus secretin PilQ n=1 Tax=Halomonas sp. 328 TaxID=2776704 RepID=UPI0018A7B60C|nr:type IV pilus secretin PilQ [Halomonas sp. 328]MBF8222349.1 type IV pilus secretin PilQ [Halomonas sp. 328]
MQTITRCLAVLCLSLLGNASAWAASTLTSLDYRQVGEGLEVEMHFQGGVPEVRGYRLDEPPRLTIDLMETGSLVDRPRQTLGVGGVAQVTTLEAGSRTRLVFTLDQELPYTTRQEGERLILAIGGAPAQPAATVTSPEPSQPVASAPVVQDPRIEDIDFRRGADGAGRLIVTFDRTGIDSRVRETSGNRILAELRGVRLPASLDQTLDVTDFSTPLTRIVPRPDRDGVTLELQASGDFAMFSTHSGRELIIEAQPVAAPAPRQVQRPRERSFSGERITLNFQDIEVRSVLSIIADFTGLNIVASDSVTGRVTLNLQDVPWDQALDLVLKSHGLASRQEGNVIVVAPAAELANIERQEIEAREQMEVLSPLVTEYLQVNYARASDLAALLRGGDGFGLLTERGRVSVDARTNTLLIQDTAEQVQEILRTIDQLDVAVRQVQIEARIVIARDSATRELGVNWGMSRPGSRVDLGGAATGTVPRGGLAVDLGGDRDPLTSFAFGYLSGDILIDLELRALESEGRSQTISQPRVITANQRTAIIKQGEERAFQSVDAQGNPETDFKEAVLSLEVTPQITPDNRIVMDLLITNDSFRDTFVGGEPPIDRNEIQTQVLVDNGETVVLGGILTTEQIRSLFKTPLLGDIPVIGNLFRYTQESNEKVELLIFITPTILEDGLALR